jgi:betaine-aldehyde dehydrogenase
LKQQNFINGKWLTGEGYKRDIINPSTEEILETVYEASSKQVNQAVDAAQAAFDLGIWNSDPLLRAKTLQKIADKLETQSEEFAVIETENTGKPIREARLDIEDTVGCLRYYAQLIKQQKAEEITQWDGSISQVRNVPIGVCALIVPWNFPLLLGMWKIAPALAAGNTIVFKPSEVTPLSMIKMTEIIDESGMPEGVFNLLLGDGKAVGEKLVIHQNVSKISFTGGTETGKAINEQCSRTFKRVSLELGGKSPLLIFDDAELNLAVEWAIFGAFFNQGEVCVASSRILVEEKIYPALLEKLVEMTKNISLGDPLLDDTEMGPLVSENHLKKVESYIQTGLKEGATLVTGGKRIKEKGYYMTPVIVTDVTSEMDIVQEEVFGPFCVIQTFKTEAEAISLANGTKFGLAAGVLSADVVRAERVAARIQAGTIWINSYHTPFVNAPWGGFKQSGLGRELGPQGLASYSEPKHINVTQQVNKLGWYSS